MHMLSSASFVALTLLASLASAAQTTTYAYNDNLPNKSEKGQSGTNHCGKGASSSSKCQNVIINGVDDFCLYGPPNGGSIGNTERVEVAYCLKSGYGTRQFPNGTIKGAHFVKTPEYVQITGWGDFTKIGIKHGDAGGELDPHGADGNGNPIGGLVFGNSYGKMQQYPEWTNFMSATEFCIRACNPASPNAKKFCAHRYDVMGCGWNMPGNYAQGVFESCVGEAGQPMGIYTTVTTISGHAKSTVYTWHQGQSPTPAAHPKPKSSNCTKHASVHKRATVEIAPGPARTAF